jgi:proteasome lid subunit RPN8/RPN11
MPYAVEKVPSESLFVPALAQFCVSGTVRVGIPRDLLNSFRRKALRQFPLEMFAHLIGHVHQPGGKVKEIEVTRFIYPPLIATKDFVEALPMDLPLEHGEKLVGSIHSHPWEVGEPRAVFHACPSAWDIQSAAECGELVYCIYNIAESRESRRRKTHLGVFLGSSNVRVEMI